MSDSKNLVTRIAERFGVDSRKFYETLKATAFKQRDGSAPSDEQMMALLVVADQYGLNPFTKEIYAFPDKQNGIIPVVGVDGWSRIINEHPAYDGLGFEYAPDAVTPQGSSVECPEWVECILYRKDRTHPTRVREYLDETYRPPFDGRSRDGKPYSVAGPWQSHPKRMLRHKAMIQASRIGFGFTGIYDQDEAERIRDMGQAVTVQTVGVDPVASATLDPVLAKLASRAIAGQAWVAAHDYVKSRYRGAELDYAIRFLREKELESVALPASSEVSHEPAPADASVTGDDERSASSEDLFLEASADEGFY